MFLYYYGFVVCKKAFFLYPTAAESEYLCDRTLKLFQGIANKCWIVNYYWVVDSRHAGHLLPEVRIKTRYTKQDSI